MQCRVFGIALGLTILSTPFTIATQRTWVERSNDHAQLLLRWMAKHNPENASAIGVDGYDGEGAIAREVTLEVRADDP